MSGKAFSREFKLAALGQIESGETIARVAREFGVSRKTIYQWRDQLRQSEGISSDQRSGAFERVSPPELPAELVSHVRGAVQFIPETSLTLLLRRG